MTFKKCTKHSKGKGLNIDSNPMVCHSSRLITSIKSIWSSSERDLFRSQKNCMMDSVL